MRGDDMASPISNTDPLSRLDCAAAIETLASGTWLARRLCVNPAVAHEVINMIHSGTLASGDVPERR
jgi:hypothetical protein